MTCVKNSTPTSLDRMLANETNSSDKQDGKNIQLPLVTIALALEGERPHFELQMPSEKLRVLLVEHNSTDAEIIRTMLASVVVEHPFQLRITNQLSSTLERLLAGGIDLILLNLDLPDSQGLQTLDVLQQSASDLPMVVLTTQHDERQGIEALQHGAQDYLVKSELSGALLIRALRYAYERKYLARALEQAWRNKQHQWYSAEVARCYQCYRSKVPLASKLCPTCDLPKDDVAIEAKYRALVYRSVRMLRAGENELPEYDQSVARLFAARGYGAREVVRFHQRVLRENEERALPIVERSFSMDARLVLIRILGRLVDIYRDWAMKFSNNEDSS
ncbi:hypothetical protein CCP3SC1_60031 [Gammaproteobacteria bacterium]